MGEFSVWHWPTVSTALLFGGSKVGGLAKGIKAFRRTMADGDPATEHRLGQAEDRHPEA